MKNKNIVPSVIFYILIFMSACKSIPDPGHARNYSVDPHSFTQPGKAVIRHMNLNLIADFEERIIHGTVTYDLLNRGEAGTIILDTRDLKIERVLADGNDTEYSLGEKDPILGRPLSIRIGEKTRTVTVYYQTTENSGALLWLSPEQTDAGTDPFLFTQGHAILTRSWIPIQDSPQIRITYSATVQVPPGLMAVMSAENPVKLSPDGLYRFRMDQPVPPYLIALAVGNIKYRPISYRSGVYAEPTLIDRVFYEFADMEKMIRAAEKNFGPYAWEQYDVIVLPPSFPFGGMENPRLTFATPTIITGDRSLTSLIAHELAHSWSGNLVTNATINDFWINEGFTVYLEMRINEELYGKERAEMLASIQRTYLDEELERLRDTPERTRLKLDLGGMDPSAANTDIPYVKGYLFLRTLEETVGRDEFDTFLKAYFREYAFSSISTEEFIRYLNEHLPGRKQIPFNAEEWIYGEGLPKNAPVIRSARLERVDSILIHFIQSGEMNSREASDWTTQEWIRLLTRIPAGTNQQRIARLDSLFDLTHAPNAVILREWYRQAILHQYRENGIDQTIGSFLAGTGRNWLVEPIYRALIANGREPEAREIYKKARPGYHHVTTSRIDALLGPGPQ